jgi:S-DNA-T family DNA segregation ATPase FtsK/SpoIIIE
MLALEERRAMEVRRDIRLLVLFAALAFVMIAELGYGGVVGKAVSSVMFGLFGATAYLIPPFVFIMVIFIISNLGKRTLPARTASLVVLMIAIGAGCELWGGEAAKAAAYDPAAIYQRCAAAKEGGGLLGGSLAYGLFSLFRNVGSVFILILLILICLLVATQFSPVARYRKAQERRIERGDPSFMEKRRMKAQQARAESQRRRELIRQEKEREREEREKLLEQERLNREERQKEAQKRADAADMLNSVIEPALQEEEEDFGLDEGSTLFRRREKKPSGTRERNAVPARERNTVPVREAEPAPERIRSNTSHGIRFLDKDRDNTAKAEEVRISAKVIESDGAEPAERILRPDPNTVRVESESMFTIDPAERNDYNRNPGRATMTVFTRTTDTGDLSDDLQFPFHKEENERSMRKIYANDNVGSYMNAGTLDIADAGGMSTFNAQQKAEPAPGVNGELPWGADALTEEEIAAIEAAEASAAAAEAAPVKEAVQAAAPVRTTVTAKEKPQQAAPPISEEDLEGIEVHRDRGEDGGKGAGRTVMSGQNRSRENRKYSFPPFSLMEKGQKANTPDIDQELKETAFRLQETLRTFGVNVTISQISQGPSITRYELQPEQGVKVSRIVNLADDIKLSLAAMDIRIEAPIPGKPAIGIEVPNKHPSLVALRDILETQEFRGAKSRLAFGVGKDLAGNTVVTDIAKMPHLLIAGATGSGKSVCINTIIMSILYKASPDEVQLIMIDPKVVELSVYNGIPHLMIPVVTDVRKASAALNWAVAEMERRYKLFAAAGTRDLNGYNAMVKAKGDEAGENEKVLTRLVVIVDELADLMMVAKNEVESSICRLAQLARAAGIHLIIATQRPSVDVITGLIKANMPSRIAFAVTSQVDSRTILDMAGAEKLIGKGDMLFYPQNYQKPARIQGAFVSDEDVQKVVSYIKANNTSDSSAMADIENQIDGIASSNGNGQDADLKGDSVYDEYFADAGRFIIEKNKASIGMLQRVFKIGFNRAARIMDQLAEAGVVSEENGTRARTVQMDMPTFEQFLEEM